MIRMDGKYRTRDGREVRLYADDGSKTYPIHGAIKVTTGWIVKSFTSDGYYNSDDMPCDSDLIEIKPAAIDMIIEWLNARIIKQYEPSVYQQALNPNAEADAYRSALTEARRIKAEAEKEG